MTRFQRNDSVLADLHDTWVCKHAILAKLRIFMAGEVTFIIDGKGKSLTCTLYNLAKEIIQISLFRSSCPLLMVTRT